MTKVHTKKKRFLRMRGIPSTRNRAARPKTFKTQESAETYAKENGMKDYTIVNLQPNKEIAKFRIEA